MPFRPANSPTRKPKRKKIDPAAADSEKLTQQLLNKNKFVTLANETADQTTKPVVTSPGSPGKKKQPPLVVKNISFAILAPKLNASVADLSYKITRFGTKVMCTSDDDVSKVRKILDQNGWEYYTHDKPSDRPYRAVIRGLPLVDPEDLRQRLITKHNLDAVAVHIIRRKEDSADREETLYLVHFSKGSTNLTKLREIKEVGHIIVRWDSYRNKRSDVTQCTNCLYHGHGTRNCHLKSRCNNCGENHDTEKCSSKDGQAKRCANCGGAHPATDRGCPKRAEYQRIRQQSSTKNRPGQRTAGKAPAAPALNATNFPALPNSSVTGEAPRFVGPRIAKHPEPTERRIDPRIRAGVYASAPLNDPSPEEATEALYSSAELWSIFTEFRGRLLRCKTKSDQVEVLGYMVCKYGVK